MARSLPRNEDYEDVVSYPLSYNKREPSIRRKARVQMESIKRRYISAV